MPTAHPTADKSFRLPSTVRPSRYAARLAIDLEARIFSGRETIDLVLDEAASEVVLHGADLDVSRAICRAGGTEHVAQVERVPVSETLVLRFQRPLPAGPAALEIAWSGGMSPGLRGLYMAGGVAVTQFEAADARRVFPCFDEPGFKAVWSLEVDAPSGLALLGNAPRASSLEQGGRQRVLFGDTPPLPTYLVAIACGGLSAAPAQVVRGVPIRTWAESAKLPLTAYGQEVAVEVLPRLEEYFGLPYAFGKLDQVGVPDFEAGAMENAGLVTFREAALLLDPATASLAVKKRIAEVVTHELAHMWFGNWVTMAWWDDLWLNEAFATWMAYKIVDAWRPAWRVWLDFDAGRAAAMHLDALRSTHPIHCEVKNADEATESFDLITYEKGGAVLRMIEGYLGEAPFREGIRLYMRRHGRANAVADDLWGALAEASRQPVLELARAWIGQGGFPLLRAELGGTTLRLSQGRFFSAPGGSDGGAARWPVPVVLRFEDDRGAREQRVLLRDVTAEVGLEAQGKVRWLCANAGASGFYRVAYDGGASEALARNLGRLAPAERVSLVADEWALVRAGLRGMGGFLDLAARFGAEEDHAVLDELVARLHGIEHRIEDERTRGRFRAHVARLLGPGLAAVGWDGRPGDDDEVRLRRAALARALGMVARDPGAVEAACSRLGRVLEGETAALEPNLHEAAVIVAARGGDARLFGRFLERFRAETDPAFKRRYLVALAHFEDPELAARAEGMALGDAVPLQEAAFFMAALLSNRVARDRFWALLRERWEALHGRLGGAPMLLRRVVEAVGQLPRRRHLEEAESFFAAHPLPAARQAIAQTLERMRQDVELWERAEADVAAWLGSRGA